MKRINKDNLLCERFDSISEFVKTNESREPLDGAKDHSADETIKRFIALNGSKWYGSDVKSFADATDLLSHGCNRISKRVIARTNKGVDETTEKTVFKAAIVGAAPIVPAAIKGVPNSMLTRKQVPIKQKVIRILYDISHNLRVKASEIENQGIKLVQAIKALERSGYRIQLDVINYAEQDPRDEAVTITIKKASQPLDIKKISFPLIHSSMLRIFAFLWYERVPSGKVDLGYGRPVANNPYYEARKTLEKSGLLDDNTVYIKLDTDIEHALMDKYKGGVK